MIVRAKLRMLDVLFAVRGTIMPLIAGRLALIAATCAGAIIVAGGHPGIFSRLAGIPFTLIGLALSIFMSFRNTVCYDRWWEGRKQWGALIIAARSLARQVSLLNEEARTQILCGVMAFAGGLAARLRGRDEAEAIAHWIKTPIADPNPTDVALRRIGTITQRLLVEGHIDAMRWHALEDQFCALSQVQAACERIAHTPVPFAYSLLLHRTAYVFCFSLPFALAGSMGWWTLLPALLVGYTFFGLDALGDQLEDPFGIEPNDLPIDSIVRNLERELLSALGETALPPALEPVAGILL
jgi:putative membrane protein